MLKFNVNTKKIISYIFQIALILIIVFAFSPIVRADSITDLQNQLDSIQGKIEKQKVLLQQKQAEKNTLQNQVDILNGQIYQTQLTINQTETDINLTQAEINKLVSDIQMKENELKDEKDKMAKAAIVLYQEQDRSMLEIFLSSQSINEVIDRTEYLNTVQIKIDESMAQIKKLKADMEKKWALQEKKKAELNDKKNKLADQKREIVSQRAGVDNLLAETKNQESQYQKLVKDLETEKSSVNNELARQMLLLAQKNNQIEGGGTGGYPAYLYYPARDTVVDSWGFYNRECTSYAAWKWNVVYGRSWYRGGGVAGTGNAKNWATILAPRNGYRVGLNPVVGAMAIWEGGTYGHVAIVEAVNADGTFNVSEFNVIPGEFSIRKNLNKMSSFGYAIKFIYP